MLPVLAVPVNNAQPFSLSLFPLSLFHNDNSLRGQQDRAVDDQGPL